MRRLWFVPVALLALFVSVFLLRVFGGPSLYDSGVYVGGAVALAHGVLPYRGWWFVQPPGSLVALLPVGLLSRWLGVSVAFGVARCLAVLLFVGLSVGVSFVVRSWGLASSLIAGCGVALSPVMMFESSAVKLELLLAALCLVAGWLLFGRSGVSYRSAGLVFGFALSVKLWAVFPLVGAVLVCVVFGLPVVWRLLGWSVVGASVVCLPFFVLDPSGMFRQVVLAQFFRRSLSSESMSLVQRFASLAGFVVFGRVVLVLVAFSFAVVVLVAVDSWRRWLSPLSLFFALAFVLSAVGLMLSSESYPYYFVFPVVFLWCFVGVVLGPYVGSWLGRSLAAGSLALVGVFGFVLSSSLASASVPAASTVVAARSVVPVGSCVVSAEYADSLLLGRPASGSCPAVLDAYGLFMRGGYHLGVPPASFCRLWLGYVRRAAFLVEPVWRDFNFPWRCSSFSRYVGSSFRVVFFRPGLYVLGRLS